MGDIAYLLLAVRLALEVQHSADDPFVTGPGRWRDEGRADA